MPPIARHEKANAFHARLLKSYYRPRDMLRATPSAALQRLAQPKGKHAACQNCLVYPQKLSGRAGHPYAGTRQDRCISLAPIGGQHEGHSRRLQRTSLEGRALGRSACPLLPSPCCFPDKENPSLPALLLPADSRWIQHVIASPHEGRSSHQAAPVGTPRLCVLLYSSRRRRMPAPASKARMPTPAAPSGR